MLVSKKIYTLATVILIAFGLFILWKYFFSLNTSSDANLPKPNTTADSLEMDTDGDGLKDWEETLYSTNPKLVDTDGDSMNDGEEVSSNRDPLKYGVGESIEVKPSDVPFPEAEFVLPEVITTDNTVEAEVTQIEPTNYEKYGETINQMAQIIIDYPVLKIEDSEAYETLFMPNESIEKYRSRYEEVIQNYRLVAYHLNNIQNKDGLQLEILRLSQAYKRIADAHQVIVDKYYTTQIAEYIEAIVEYSDAMVNAQQQLNRVTEFIIIKKIKFKPGDAGQLFLFGA